MSCGAPAPRTRFRYVARPAVSVASARNLMIEDARSGADAVPPSPYAGDASISPSLTSGDAQESTAYELKFLVADAVAGRVRAWAETRLLRDVHAESDGGYRTTTLYLDGPDWPVLRRDGRLRRRKYRVRRYGAEPILFLERKTRKGDRVRKLRVSVPEAEIARLGHPESTTSWPGAWFHTEFAQLGLAPVCRVGYRRTAFFGSVSSGAVRLTLDRGVVGVRDDGWRVAPVPDGADVLDGMVICELKFRDVLPEIFKALVAEIGLTPSGVSKYRRCMERAGVRLDGGGGDA
jgi:hypothetical protein